MRTARVEKHLSHKITAFIGRIRDLVHSMKRPVVILDITLYRETVDAGRPARQCCPHVSACDFPEVAGLNLACALEDDERCPPPVDL